MAAKNWKFELFIDKRGDWWWHLRARNGQIVANSAEGYRSKLHAKRMIQKIAGAIFNGADMEVKLGTSAGSVVVPLEPTQ